MNNLNEGDKVWFEEEKQGYTVQACNERFAVCTKPYNPKKTVLYTIIDFTRGIRGADNKVFGNDYETRKQCQKALTDLAGGSMEVSYRNNVPLNIVKHKLPISKSLRSDGK